jgi:hypothetical protein
MEQEKQKMKTFMKLIVPMSMLLLFAAIPGMAQIDTRVVFQAPFAFYAGNAKLPAGSYTVTQPDDNADLLLIEDANGSHSVFVEYVPAPSQTPASKTEVTFSKYGKTEFLNHISLQGQTYGIEILRSKTEQNAAKTASTEKHSLAAKNGR